MHYKGLNRLQTTVRIGRAWPRVKSYRHPTERWMLLVTIVIIILSLIATGTFSLEGLIIFFIIGFIINYAFIRSFIEAFKRDAIEVSDTQFPEIKALVDDCRRHVDIPPDTRVYVVYNPGMNAFAVGLGRPYSIILFSALVDNMDADELKYVIGHEMGHIKFGHTILLTLIGQLGMLTYGIPILGFFYRFFFLFWRRAAELTADRAGLVGTGRIDKAISAQVKFGAGPWLAQWVDTEMLARQARESSQNTWAAFSETFGTHPLMTTRIQRLANFAMSDMFRILRPDIRQKPYNRNKKGQPAPNAAPKLSTTPPPSKKQIIRRLVPGSLSKLPTAPEDDEEMTPETASSPPSPRPEPRQLDWPQELGFNRLNVSAIRANAEQAEMWLRLGEMLQSHGQTNEAAQCLQRAKSLITGSISLDASDELPHNLLLAAGKSATGLMASSPHPACPQCGMSNPPGTHYCGQCQTQLQKPCLECGTWLPASYPNCTHCGHNQAQTIAALKAEAKSARKLAEHPLPPRRLTKWEVIFGPIFLGDILMVLLTLAWQAGSSAPMQMWAYIAAAFLILQFGIIAAVRLAKKRTARYWQLFDDIELATRRYNDIADTLAQQNLTLDPPRLEPKDPWRWVSSP